MTGWLDGWLGRGCPRLLNWTAQPSSSYAYALTLDTTQTALMGHGMAFWETWRPEHCGKGRRRAGTHNNQATPPPPRLPNPGFLRLFQFWVVVVGQTPCLPLCELPQTTPNPCPCHAAFQTLCLPPACITPSLDSVPC